MKRILNNLSWSLLSALGKSRLLKTAYLWLFIVPICAKLLNNIESVVNVQLFHATFSINLALPFSWVVFFFSAVAISAGDAIYSLRCPALIKEHSTFSGFQESGKGITQLKKYYKGIVDGDEYGEIPRTTFAGPDGQIDNTSWLQDEFWDLRYYADKCRPLSRVICGGLYVVGLMLVLFLFMQNIWYVWHYY